MYQYKLAEKSSHREIHKLAYHQAEQITDCLRKMWDDRESQVRLLETAYRLVVHWETKTLAHAVEEEKGIYVLAVTKQPALYKKILELAEEHQLLRILVHQIKAILEGQGFNDNVLSRFDTLLLINEFHNYKEENRLLGIGLW